MKQQHIDEIIEQHFTSFDIVKGAIQKADINLFEEHENDPDEQNNTFKTQFNEEIITQDQINILAKSFQKATRQQKNNQSLNIPTMRKARGNWNMDKYNKLITYFSSKSNCKNYYFLPRIAKELNFSLGTIRNCWNEYQTNSSIPSLARLITHNSSNKIQKKEEKFQFYKRLIIEVAEQNGLLSCSEIRKIVNAKAKQSNRIQHLKDISLSYVTKILIQSQFKWKRVNKLSNERNSVANIQKRYQYCLKYAALKNENVQICFLDSTHIHLFSQRNFGWTKNSESDSTIIHSATNCISVLCVVGVEGLAAWQIYEKQNKEVFTKALVHLIKYMIGKKSNKRRLMIFDINNIDHINKQQCCNTLEKLDFQILLIPPFSSMLNPIYSWFIDLKSKINKYKWKTESQLLNITKQKLSDYSVYSVQQYYKNLQIHLNKGLAMEKI